MVSYSSHVVIMVLLWSLNPCCSGRWSRTFSATLKSLSLRVLILVVVEDGLVLLAMLAPGAADIES